MVPTFTSGGAWTAQAPAYVANSNGVATNETLNFQTNSHWVIFGGSGTTMTTNGTNAGLACQLSLKGSDQTGLFTVTNYSQGSILGTHRQVFTLTFGTPLASTNFTVSLWPVTDSGASLQGDASFYIYSWTTNGFVIGSDFSDTTDNGELGTFEYFVAPWH
jgi:hypothetical protein